MSRVVSEGQAQIGSHISLDVLTWWPKIDTNTLTNAVDLSIVEAALINGFEWSVDVFKRFGAATVAMMKLSSCRRHRAIIIFDGTIDGLMLYTRNMEKLNEWIEDENNINILRIHKWISKDLQPKATPAGATCLSLKPK